MIGLRTSSAIAAALMVSTVVLANPVSSADTSPKPSASPAQANVTDKDLRAFAKAYVEYHKIRQDYEPRLNGTKDEKEKEKLQREGNDKVKQALERQGLTPQSYNRLFGAVNSNPQLRQKALTLINEERNKS